MKEIVVIVTSLANHKKQQLISNKFGSFWVNPNLIQNKKFDHSNLIRFLLNWTYVVSVLSERNPTPPDPIASWPLLTQRKIKVEIKSYLLQIES